MFGVSLRQVAGSTSQRQITAVSTLEMFYYRYFESRRSAFVKREQAY